MSFTFPVFLLAGIALVIPVLIHLFHLRKYKRVNFSDTRFLRNIQLKTKRQAKLQNIRLLLARLLFLSALIFAFAQPFFGKKNTNDNNLQVLFIDNSPSMNLRKGQISLLQTAKDKAIKLINEAPADARFVILDNSNKNAQRPVPKNEAITAIKEITPIANHTNLQQIFAKLSEHNEELDIYFFSDLQKSAFLNNASSINTEDNFRLNFVPIQEKSVGNVYIDTAFFVQPNIDINAPNNLVVQVNGSGNLSELRTYLQVNINNQMRSASEIILDENTNSWTDTLPVQLSGSEWHKIEISVQDKHLITDDTYRIAARAVPEINVLAISDNIVNPYLQTAFNSYPGFKLQSTSFQNLKKDSWQQYSLIILENITTLNSDLVDAIQFALQNGQNILMFPGKINNTELFNNSMSKIAAISFSPLDTTKQIVTGIQQSHQIFADVFDEIPENVQLPISKKRYPIHASLSANQQILMSFRDGKPFMAQYNIAKGKFYLCATALNEASGNFQTSHYFAPLIYKMASLNGNSNVFAQTIGNNKPIWISNKQYNDRNLWELKGNGFEGIPTQIPSGTGINISTDRLILQPGFYTLNRKGDATENIILAFNVDNKESILDYTDKHELESILNKEFNWLQQENISVPQYQSLFGSTTPLWKYFLIASLIFLIIETLLLHKRKTTNLAE